MVTAVSYTHLVEADISEIDLYGYNIIETSLSMVHRLQTVLNDLRTKIQTYVFPVSYTHLDVYKRQGHEGINTPELSSEKDNTSRTLSEIDQRTK